MTILLEIVVNMDMMCMYFRGRLVRLILFFICFFYFSFFIFCKNKIIEEDKDAFLLIKAIPRYIVDSND